MAVGKTPGVPAAPQPHLSDAALDEILALQLLVAWAGEGLCRPKRLGWWETDLIDPDGGGDLLARLAPRTHAWAALEAIREAARQVDTKARERHGQPDRLRSLYFFGFELDERLADRLAVHKRDGGDPAAALPLPFPLGRDWQQDKVVAAFGAPGSVAFDAVPPVGRQLKGQPPEAPNDMARRLVAALVPPSAAYPFPFYRLAG